MCKANRIHTKNKTKNITIAYTKDGIEKTKKNIDTAYEKGGKNKQLWLAIFSYVCGPT